MLSTIAAGIAIAISLVLSGIALIFARKALQMSAATMHWSRNDLKKWVESNSDAAKGAQIAELNVAVADLSDSVDVLQKGIHKLRSRNNMRNLRSERKAAQDGPDFDPSTTTDKAKLRDYLRKEGRLN